MPEGINPGTFDVWAALCALASRQDGQARLVWFGLV